MSVPAPPLRLQRAPFPEPEFRDLMAEQMRHAPWLLLSILLHALLVIVVMLLPAESTPRAEVLVTLQPPIELPALPPPEPPKENVKNPAEPDEPKLQDVDLPPTSDLDADLADFSPDSWTPSNEAWRDVVGLGPASATAGRRGSGRQRLRQRGGGDRAIVIERGLQWLAAHQDDDGKWDADDFMKHDEQGEPCDGPGNAMHDVGVTGLALLAFLGDGSTLRSGPYRDVVKRGVRWLRQQQDQATGLFGSKASHDFVYDHAIAAYAMVEAYGLSESPILRDEAQGGIDYLESHRNPYSVWRYQPQSGDNDTSITGWCVMAYESAADFELQVNETALDHAATWFDSVTDPSTGRCGYTARGQPSSRVDDAHRAKYPPQNVEALTAVGLMCRFFLGQDPKQNPVMESAANTILDKPPVADQDVYRGSVDHYYWYYATYALYQMGGHWWSDWSKKLTDSVVHTQRDDGNFKGSWDPVGAWGQEGGRVYSTAILVLSLEAYYRYSRLVR